jgi:hypothetical protein
LIYLLCFRFAIATPVLWRSSWIKENDPDLFKLGHGKTGHSRTHNAGAGTIRLIESDMFTFGTAALTACAMLHADGGATCDPAHYHETGTSKLTYVLESNSLVSCDVRCDQEHH